MSTVWGHTHPRQADPLGAHGPGITAAGLYAELIAIQGFYNTLLPLPMVFDLQHDIYEGARGQMRPPVSLLHVGLDLFNRWTLAA